MRCDAACFRFILIMKRRERQGCPDVCGFGWQQLIECNLADVADYWTTNRLVSWLDGPDANGARAIGYAAIALDSQTEAYANVARTTLDAITAYAEDVRAGRQIKGSNQSKEQFRPLRTPRSDGSA
jgi:hypothetical protein